MCLSIFYVYVCIYVYMTFGIVLSYNCDLSVIEYRIWMNEWPMFSGSSYPMRLFVMLIDQTESGIFKMAASKSLNFKYNYLNLKT